VVLVFISCGKSESDKGVTLMSGEQERSDDTNSDASTFKVQAMAVNFEAHQEEKIRKASELIRKVISSETFKRRVLNYRYNGKKAFIDNDGLTNAQIYKKILAGRELMTNLGKNHTMDLEIELYSDPDSITIGYTYPNIVRIFMNAKYFNRFLPYEVADNMMHEWLHKLGFDHSVENTPERPHSVPYAIGYIMRDLARKLEGLPSRKGMKNVEAYH
jgi:hypothetical protein